MKDEKEQQHRDREGKQRRQGNTYMYDRFTANVGRKKNGKKEYV